MRLLIALLLLCSCATVHVQNNIEINIDFDYDQNGVITKKELKERILELEKDKRTIIRNYNQTLEETQDCSRALIYEVK